MYSGYAIFAYKERYTPKIKPKTYQKNVTHKQPKKDQMMEFIREIYRVKPETGNIDYMNCDCASFPEYEPS